MRQGVNERRVQQGPFVFGLFALCLDRRECATAGIRSRIKSETMSSLDIQLDAFQHYLLIEKGLARNTLEAYAGDVQRFCHYLNQQGTSPLHQLTRDDVIGYLAARRQQGISARTTARELVAIKAFYAFMSERSDHG